MGEPSGDDCASVWTVRTGEPSDRDRIRALWLEVFGRTTDMTAWIGAAFDGGDGTDDRPVDPDDLEAFVAVDGEDVPVAFTIVALLGPQEASRYVRGIVPADEFPETTAIIHMLAVDEGWRDAGVATAVVGRCFDWGDRRADVMLATLWVREDAPDAAPVAAEHDFPPIARVKGFYREGRLRCPDCGDPCTCEATINVKPFPETDEGDV
jgi:GNAT superfamily N-acetyltransferase